MCGGEEDNARHTPVHPPVTLLPLAHALVSVTPIAATHSCPTLTPHTPIPHSLPILTPTPHSLPPHTHSPRSLPPHTPTPHSLPPHTHSHPTLTPTPHSLPPHTHSHPILTTSFLCKTASQSIALNHLCCFTSSTPCCRMEPGQSGLKPGQWNGNGTRTKMREPGQAQWNRDRESVEWNHQMDSLVTNSNDTSWNQFVSHYYLRQYLGQISCQYYNINGLN